MTIRQRLSTYLDDLESWPGTVTNLAIAALVLLSSAIFIAETYTIPLPLRHRLDVINNVILVVFAVEYLLRFWCAENKLRYVVGLYSLIDLLAIVPFFLTITDISFIRIFRWFRILRLIRLFEGQTILGRYSSQDGAITIRILFTLFAIIFVYSGLIYQVEHAVNPNEFTTFLDAVYFSVVTMTTVGFGDVTPNSDAGRLLTVLMILTGIALIPWQLGDLIRRLVKSPAAIAPLSEQPVQIIHPCPTCQCDRHDPDAQFCKRCGTRLTIKNPPLS